MNDPDPEAAYVAALSVVVLLVFVGALVVSMVTIILRVIAHRRHGYPVPTLMPRDLALVGGLLLPFTAILTVRAFGLAAFVAGELWWVAVTGIPAVAGAVIFAYYEVRVIGTGRWRR